MTDLQTSSVIFFSLFWFHDHDTAPFHCKIMISFNEFRAFRHDVASACIYLHAQRALRGFKAVHLPEILVTGNESGTAFLYGSQMSCINCLDNSFHVTIVLFRSSCHALWEVHLGAWTFSLSCVLRQLSTWSGRFLSVEWNQRGWSPSSSVMDPEGSTGFC